MLKRIFNSSKTILYKYVNLLTFKRFNVIHDDTFTINGFIFIANSGKIEIGKNFKANSGKNHNPIGGDTQLRFICGNNAKIKIGDNCGISNSTLISQTHITIGDNVMIGGGCKLWDTDFHSLKPDIRTSGFDNDIKSSPIFIENNAFVGGGSIVLKGVTVGENSIIAAGSVVTKSVPKNEVWGGNPAKFIKNLK